MTTTPKTYGEVKIIPKRYGPGYYEYITGDHTFIITHIEEDDRHDGYGRRDHWIVAHTGPAVDWTGEMGWDNNYPSDPIATYREAKVQVAFILKDCGGTP